MQDFILVTGGAGYIGAIATEVLLSKGYKVIVLDDLSTGYKDSIFPNSIFYNSKVGNKNTLKEIFSNHKVNAVIHFAGAALVEESVRIPEKYFDVNFIQPLNLLEVMNDFNVDKIIFSSTCAVYGIPEKIPISEDQVTKPINPYGESKLLFENALNDCKEKYNLKYIALRYFNVAGATKLRGEKHNPETHLIPTILKSIKNKEIKLKVFGKDHKTKDGTAVRDYIHVLDLIDGHIKALEAINSNKTFSNIYNLGYGCGYSVLEIINAVEEVINEKIIFEFHDKRAGDPAELVANPKKIKEELNWNPKHDNLHEIINSALCHF